MTESVKELQARQDTAWVRLGARYPHLQTPALPPREELLAEYAHTVKGLLGLLGPTAHVAEIDRSLYDLVLDRFKEHFGNYDKRRVTYHQALQLVVERKSIEEVFKDSKDL